MSTDSELREAAERLRDGSSYPEFMTPYTASWVSHAQLADLELLARWAAQKILTLGVQSGGDAG